MKVGILTFHRAFNYGAVLQAYSLKEVISNFENVEVDIINYACYQVELDHNPKYTFQKMGFPKGLIGFYGRFMKYLVFNGFKNRKFNFKTVYNKENIKNIANDYDIFIAGSDQIWSNKFSGFDTTFLLDFVKDNKKKYSYAASFGFSEFPKNTENVYRKYLKDFQKISVREKSAVDMLKNEFGLDSFVSLDPTLILGREKWKKFCTPPARNKKYILIYTIQPPINLIKYAKRLSEETGLELLYLSNSYRQYQEIKHIRLVSPEEFVGWFANAEYVLTNSFHGTAFSLIFNKNLVVEIQTQKSLNTRSKDLLSLCGLNKRILTKDYNNFRLNNIDWDSVNKKLETEKNKSVDYLREICSDKG